MRAHEYEIKTERLLLRPMTVEDAEAVWKWVSDERVARYMVYPTYTDKEKLDGSCKMRSKEFEGVLE